MVNLSLELGQKYGLGIEVWESSVYMWQLKPSNWMSPPGRVCRKYQGETPGEQ